MLLEDQRYIHEDLERLEQGIADRMSEEPKHVSLIYAPLSIFSLVGEQPPGFLKF